MQHYTSYRLDRGALTQSGICPEGDIVSIADRPVDHGPQKRLCRKNACWQLVGNRASWAERFSRRRLDILLPFTTSGGALRKRRSTRWSRNSLRASSFRSKREPDRACRSLSKTSSRPFSNAAFWPTDFCACAVLTVRARSWWRFPASGAGFAPRAARGEWRRAPRTGSIRSSRVYRSGNGCCRFRSRCAFGSLPTPSCSRRCTASCTA